MRRKRLFHPPNIPCTPHRQRLLSTQYGPTDRKTRHLRCIHRLQLYHRRRHHGVRRPRSAYMGFHLGSYRNTIPKIGQGDHARDPEITLTHARRPTRALPGPPLPPADDHLSAKISPHQPPCKIYQPHPPRPRARTGSGTTRASPRRSGKRAQWRVHMGTDFYGSTRAASTGRAARSCRRR